MTTEPRLSPIGEAMGWVARIMAIGMTMFIPGVAGTWIDARLGTSVLGPMGMVIGFSAGMLAITRLRVGSRRHKR